MLFTPNMLRVTISHQSSHTVRFKVEGKLTRDSCMELERAHQQLAGTGRKFDFDLSGLTFIDGAGTMLVRELIRKPNELVACSEYAQAILERHETGTASRATQADGLLARLQAGDEEAFEWLVRQFGGRMLAVARRFFACEADARDVLQEAFIAAFKSIGDFKGNSSLATWLHRIVVNAALMNLRQRKRRPVQSISELLPQFNECGDWFDSDSGALLPDAVLEEAETRAIVRRNIAELPEAYRAVLILRDIEDIDGSEVATLLGISENAVKVRLHRARQALRTLLARQYEENRRKVA
jgi:RNA polymerase sigma-70 factor (ECF subfamily)